MLIATALMFPIVPARKEKRTMTTHSLCPSVSVVLCSLAVAVASPAQAQNASRWEVEVHGGGTFANSPADGTSAMPQPGQPFTTLALAPSRRSSSWYFGDGAALLNAVNAYFFLPSTSRITPLDPVLTKAGATRGNGGTYGFRISYAVTPRFAAEFNLDASQSRLKLTDALLAGVEASRASFTSAWNGLISTGGGFIFTEASTTSTSAINAEGGRQLLTTGALVINLATQGNTIPYVTIGAGALSTSGELPSATLTGNYRFDSLNALAPGRFPVNETDVVRIRVAADTRFATVAGGGIKFMRSARWGARADVRAHISKNAVNLLLDATPTVASQIPAGAIASFTIPSLQFSNNASTGVQSSLSGPPISGFRTFSGSGTEVHLSVTGGIIFRF
jgi:hypothetical protein